MAFSVRAASVGDSAAVAAMIHALTSEIMARTGTPHFDIDLVRLQDNCLEFLREGRYQAYLALDAGGRPVGVATLCESYALYAGGRFGVLQEFYVAPEVRSSGVGRSLIEATALHGKRAGWLRLEMCTPPLPEFERTLKFYEENGFEITGGRKMKRLL